MIFLFGSHAMVVIEGISRREGQSH